MARRHLIEKILPARQVHLVGGPSGIGKTRWIVYLLINWLLGKQVLGFKSYPEKMMYFATDRNEESLEETFKAFDLNDLFIWKSLLSSKWQKIEDVIKANLGVKLFVFDPIMLFVPGHKYIDYGTVAQFLRHLTELCVQYDITIIGIVHTAKMKENALFVNPRERLLGSAAWGAYAETLFILGSDNFEDPENSQIRNVHVLPRNAAEFKLYWKFDNHGIPVSCSAPRTAPAQDYVLSVFLDHLPVNTDLTTSELLVIASSIGMSRMTMFRMLKKAVENMDLEQVAHGIYKKIPPAIVC
jgi:hypothetical protein